MGKTASLTEVIHDPSELTHELSHQNIHKLGKIYIWMTIRTGKRLWNVFLYLLAEPAGSICPLVCPYGWNIVCAAMLVPCGTSAPTLAKMVAQHGTVGYSRLSTAVITTLAWRKTTSVLIQNSAQHNFAKLPRIEDQGYYKHTISAFCQEWKPATIYWHKSFPPAPNPSITPHAI